MFLTTNGPAAIRAVKDADTVLVAAMRNGAAVYREAWREATARGADLAVVCAGRERGFSVDDAYWAGYVVDARLRSRAARITTAARSALPSYESSPDT